MTRSTLTIANVRAAVRKLAYSRANQIEAPTRRASLAFDTTNVQLWPVDETGAYREDIRDYVGLAKVCSEAREALAAWAGAPGDPLVFVAHLQCTEERADCSGELQGSTELRVFANGRVELLTRRPGGRVDHVELVFDENTARFLYGRKVEEVARD